MKKAFVAGAALVIAAGLLWWRSAPDAPRPSAPRASSAPRAPDRDNAAAEPGASPRDSRADPGPSDAAPDVAPPVRADPSAPGRKPESPPSRDVGGEPPRAPDRPLVVEAEPPPAPVAPASPPVSPPAVPLPAPPPVAIEREPAPPAPVRPPAASEVDLAAVQSVVSRYEQTYRQLDVNAVVAIWPSVDRRSLSRMFERLERQDLRFETCAYAVAEGRATATCAGSLTYVPKVGGPTPRTDRHTWSIQLERAGRQWQIVSVAAE